jgi:dienelactone hydrolase
MLNENLALLEQPILEENEFLKELRKFLKRHIPPLEIPKTADEWIKKSDELRQDILKKIVYYGVPEKWYKDNPQIVWGDTIETDKGYIIRKLRYSALPNLWIPALLYEPKEIKGKVPAILNVNGHVGPPGKTQDYEQIRCINLAKRGMLALHPEWLVFGELGTDDFKHNRLAYLDLCGATGLSVFYLAMKRGIDVLEMNQNTDPKRIAMTGLSGGGWQTIILSSLDTRISATAPNAGYIGLDYRADFIQDTGDLEQNPNDLLTICDYPCLTAMLAPRPTLLIYNEKDDCCFQTHRALPSVFEPIKPFFKLFEKLSNFSLHNNTVPGTHNYDKDNREQFYKFINRHFLANLNTIDEEIPSDEEILEYDKLKVGVPEDNANFFTLASEMMKDMPKNCPPALDSNDFKQWQNNGRKTLKEIIRFNEMKVSASKVLQSDHSIKQYKLSLNDEFSIPVVVLSSSDNKNDNVVLMFADKGKSTLSDIAKHEIEQGSTVILIDPAFIGENLLSWQYVQMVSAIGERVLGIQTAQVGAIAEWVCQEVGSKKVSLYVDGWNASLVAIITCALHNNIIKKVSVKNHLPSLKMLIKNHLDYETYPVLFCFGLLEQFDVNEIMALCLPTNIETK